MVGSNEGKMLQIVITIHLLSTLMIKQQKVENTNQ